MEQSYGNEYTISFNAFMRDYLSVKTGAISRMDRVYEGFKAYTQSNKSPDNIEEIVEDIYGFSSLYVAMVFHDLDDKDLQQAFKSISRLKMDVSYPFLLPIYNDYKTGQITKETFLEILNLSESYVFRRAITGIPTNSLNKTFATLYKSINKENYLESLTASFLMMDSYKRFPTDFEFEKEMKSKDVYNFRSRNYLLNKLENEGSKEIINTDAYTIEHIMPQNTSLSEEWKKMLGENFNVVQQTFLHTIGNLTLTGYNSELSDRSFYLKKTIEGGFNDSPIRLNKFMKKVDEWNQETIEERGAELAKKASFIWKAPVLSPETLSKYKIVEVSEAKKYTIDHFDFLNGELLELYLALRQRVLNIDSSVKEEYKKLYIAFKSATNFVDVIPQKVRLVLSLNIDFEEIVDPKGLAYDVKGFGRWGNGNVEVNLKSINELDDIIDLIQQAFDLQMEN